MVLYFEDIGASAVAPRGVLDRRVMTRLAPLLVCCSLAMGCTSAGKKADEKDVEAVDAPKVEETQEPAATPGVVSSIGLPASTYAIVTVPDPSKRLEEIRALAGAIAPSGPDSMGALAKPLEAFDVAHPIHLLVLDPQSYDSPVAVIGRVTDAEALMSLLPPGTEVRTSGELTILATPDTAKNIDPWVAESLPKRATPSVITADVDTEFSRKQYAMFRPLLMMGMKQDAPGAEAGLKMFELMESAGAQVGGLQVRIELGADRFDLVFVLEGKPDTTFQALARAQSAVRLPADLARKVATEDAHMIGAANLTLESRRVMEQMVNVLISSSSGVLPEHFAKFMKRWNEASGDKMAFSGTMTALTQMSVGYYIEVGDEAKAKAFLDEDWRDYFSQSFESMGISKFEGKGCTTDSALLGDGVDVIKCEGHTSFVEQPNGVKLPDQDTNIAGAVVDGFMLMAMGDPERIVTLQQGLRAEPTLELPWLADAQRRNEWGAFYMDLGRVAQATGAPGAPGAAMEFATGSEGDAITMRIGLPAQALAAFASMGGGSPYSNSGL